MQEKSKVLLDFDEEEFALWLEDLWEDELGAEVDVALSPWTGKAKVKMGKDGTASIRCKEKLKGTYTVTGDPSFVPGKQYKLAQSGKYAGVYAEPLP